MKPAEIAKSIIKDPDIKPLFDGKTIVNADFMRRI
jgi:hypothetical protein